MNIRRFSLVALLCALALQSCYRRGRALGCPTFGGELQAKEIEKTRISTEEDAVIVFESPSFTEAGELSPNEEPQKAQDLPNENANAEAYTSTFSIDVDNASYTNSRNLILNYAQLPDTNLVRLEEMINYFDYDYPDATAKEPFAIYTEVAGCPWDVQKQLLHIGVQGKKLDYNNLKPSNLVFLVDVSGSMDEPNKLDLLRQSLKLLADKLQPTDRVAIVAYAGAAGLVLPSVPASNKKAIINSLDALQSGGSTAGGEGIVLAYKIARENFIADGNNRVILATDGDFNVGISDTEELLRLIEQERQSKVFLTALAFGQERYNDEMLENITNAGNGNYFYIDNMREARKVFEKELLANLFTIAKDVKIQLAFNPAVVKSFKLIGYDNRRLENKDFADDKKDAGELGAGHSVTALYEVELQPNAAAQKAMLELRLRYKPLQSDKSELISHRLNTGAFPAYGQSSLDFRFAAAVAAWGLMLDGRIPHTTQHYELIKTLAKPSAARDPYKEEFLTVVAAAQALAKL